MVSNDVEYVLPRRGRLTLALLIYVSPVAQVWSPYLYDKKYSPRYRIAFATNTVMAAAAVMFCLILRFCLARENKKMAEREIADREGAETKRIRYVL